MLAGAAKQDIKEREVTILGDRNTPYKVLRKVMATATDAEYGKVSLAVIERETGGAPRPRAHRVADQLSPCNRHGTRSLLSPVRPALVADRGSRAALPQGRAQRLHHLRDLRDPDPVAADARARPGEGAGDSRIAS